MIKLFFFNVNFFHYLLLLSSKPLLCRRQRDSSAFFHAGRDFSPVSFEHDVQNPKIDSHIPSSLYSNIIAQTPVVCVDLLLYAPQIKKYLMLKRSQRPILGLHAHVGGRLKKGETFFSAATRKVKEECGLEDLEVEVSEKDTVSK